MTNDPKAPVNTSRLLFARILLLIGLLIGLRSFYETIAHLADPQFTLPIGSRTGEGHAKYHVFREAIHDVSAMLILLGCFFGPAQWRTRATWWICCLTAFGYYAAFWIGVPFSADLRAPHIMAEIVHLAMALPVAAALFLTRNGFSNEVDYTS